MKSQVASSNREPLIWKGDSGEIQICAVSTSSPERCLLVLSKKARRSNGSAVTEVLSRRELEVARWIREGKTNADIAGIMGISTRTVEKHVEHIFEKLGVESRLAVATRLID